MTVLFRNVVPAATALLFVLTAAVGAHPHSWIDLRSTVVLNDKGAVTALHVEWTFDEFYSTFVLEDIANAGEDLETALEQVNRENLEGLKAYNFFTDVRADGERIGLLAPTDGTLDVYRDRLRMVFTIPLATPVDPRKVLFEYAVFDPTYYIEILHFDRNAIAFAGPSGVSCSAELEKPNPDADVISLAASLDQTAIAPDNLGKLFAEIVTVSCIQ